MMDHESRLAELRERESALVAELDDLARAFVAEVAAQLANDLPAMARKLGMGQQAATLALGQEGMAKLRADVQALQDGMAGACEKALLVPTVWGHLHPEGGYRPSKDPRGETALPALLTQDLEEAYPREPGLRQRYAWALADCLGPFVALLVGAGFTTTRARGEDEPVAPDHELVYGQFNWPAGVLALHGSYRELVLGLRELRQQLLECSEAQATAELAELWHLFE